MLATQRGSIKDAELRIRVGHELRDVFSGACQQVNDPSSLVPCQHMRSIVEEAEQTTANKQKGEAKVKADNN